MSCWSISSPNLQSHKHTHKETDRKLKTVNTAYITWYLYILEKQMKNLAQQMLQINFLRKTLNLKEGGGN